MTSASRERRYEVVLTETASKMLRDIKRKRGRQTYEQVKAAIQDLSQKPVQKTQALTGLLGEFRSMHLGRFRLVVKIAEAKLVVCVVGVGWHTSGDRNDVYRILERMARRGTLGG